MGPHSVGAVPTFEQVARSWHTLQAPRWKPRHAANVLKSLHPVFARIGHDPVSQVTPRQVLDALREVERRGAIEEARRIRQRISNVYGLAIAEGVAESDPAASITRALAPLPVKGQMPAVLTLADARSVLAAVEGVAARPTTRLAHRLLALTVLRPAELAGAIWAEFRDLDGPAPTWIVPAARMKKAREHHVPLARQAVAVLDALRTVSGASPCLFPSRRDPARPMHTGTLGHALREGAWKRRHVPHGWRATFATLMNEANPADYQVIELMLSHVNRDAVARAYNRAAHMPRRRELAQLWADMLLDGFGPAAGLLEGMQR